MTGVAADESIRRDAERVEELNGTDPVAYVLAVNINRRHLSKCQRAMAVARLYPESPESGGRGSRRE
jgi:hypothetical protein